MSAPVDIFNLALSNIGDDARVASIFPPDQTVQATYGARFYPIALRSLLEAHSWGFATRRAILAQINATVPYTPSWQYAYALPTDFLSAQGIQDANSTSDATYAEIEYVVESASNGAPILLTNQPTAMLRYTAYVTDSEQFSPMFVETLSWFISAKVAGPIIKGAEGRAAALAALQMAEKLLQKATNSDAGDKQQRPIHIPEWLAVR